MTKITDRLYGLIEQLKNPIVLVVIGFIALGVWGLLLGQAYESLIGEYPNAILVPNRWKYFLINLAPELAGIAVGVGTIDYLNKRRQDQELKRQLIRQLGSKHSEVSDTAANELRANGRAPKEGDNWLTDGSLTGVIFWDVNLSRANLREANLAGVTFWDANLIKAQLWNANLANAQLYKANLRETDLRKANLSGAKLTKADLRDANLTGANLAGVNLTGAKVTDEQLSQAMLNEMTTMPNGKKYTPSEGVVEDFCYMNNQHK